MRTFQEYFSERLQSNENTQAILKVAFQDYQKDKDIDTLLLVLYSVAQAKGFAKNFTRFKGRQ